MGAVEKRQATADVAQQISDGAVAEQIRQALPPDVTFDRFRRAALVAVQQNDDVLNGDRRTLYTALVRCAQDGLLPDGREAALVRYGSTIQYMPMIGGLRKAAADSGLSLIAYAVFEHDDFDYALGTDPWVQHKPPKLTEPRGNPIGAYAVATDSLGRKFVDVMGKDQVERVRKVSRAANGPAWRDWWDQMACKSVGRRLFKQLPLVDLSDRARRVLEQADLESDLETPEDKVAAGIGQLQPPTDGHLDPDDTVDGVATEVPAEGPDGEPDTAAVDASSDEPGAPDAAPAADASPSAGMQDVPPMDGEGQGSMFEQMAEQAQQRRGRRQQTA